MTTTSSTRATMPIDPKPKSEHASPAPTKKTRRRFPWRGLCMTSIISSVIIFNGWWYWRETRPLDSLSIVASWLQTKRYAEAESALRERLRRSPHDADARIMLAQLFGARNDLRNCARELHQVPEWSPKKAEALYREGSVYMMLDRAKDAEAAFRKVLADDPLHPVAPDIFHDAAFEILKILATEDRWDDAHVVIWRIYDESSLDDQNTVLIWRMRSEVERVSHAESIVLLRRYVAADPDDREALRALAVAEVALNLRDEAEKHFQDGLKRYPDDARIWVDYLTMLHRQGSRDPWLDVLARVPKTAETEPEIWKFRGLSKEYAADLAGAAEAYRRAIELDPGVIEYEYRLSIVEERLGHTAEAAKHRERSQKLRKARTELPSAYSDFLAIRNTEGATPKEIAAAMLRLASICRAIGFTRAAEAWERLAGVAS